MRKDNLFISLAAALLTFLVFSYVLGFVVYDKPFYYNQYEKNEIYNQFPKAVVNNVTDDLLGYFKNERTNNLITSSFFNQKEKLHLLDVKNILQKESTFSTWIRVIFIGLIILLWPSCKKGRHPYRKIAFLAGASGFLGVLVIALATLTDFNALFTGFHLLLFTNDLWMLNPATDNLIVLFPEHFFVALAWRFFMGIGILYGCLFAVGLFLTVQSH